MEQVVVLGGGLAGCTTALELANLGFEVILVEQSDRLGGKVRDYGCKASGKCNNCGLCLSQGLWKAVEANSKIDLRLKHKLIEVTGEYPNIQINIEGPQGSEQISNITSLVVAVGFEFSSLSCAQLEVEPGSKIITGSQLEKIAKDRSLDAFFEDPPRTIAFIQCFGSRNIKERATYCSKVCCGYSTRLALAIKKLHPETKITFFYMDLQQVKKGNYFDELVQEGIEFIKCRPVSINKGEPDFILYEHPGKTGLQRLETDLTVLTEGIRPSASTEELAELCQLAVDQKGFLKTIKDSAKTGIYVVGCAKGPAKIEETYSEALLTARKIAAQSNLQFKTVAESGLKEIEGAEAVL
ncbi:FAD-dependent oxidoreductase [Bacillota bacterium LX-D]|nr:FAD-dependent oxidoreductase [Bacillota bacterium LX-D]